MYKTFIIILFTIFIFNKSIAVEKIPNIGMGKSINDRLNRASRYK